MKIYKITDLMEFEEEALMLTFLDLEEVQKETEYYRQLNERLIRELELTDKEVRAIEEKAKKEVSNLFENLREVL